MLFACTASCTAAGTPLARFELKESLDHPLYWWPKTLLRYPVDFSGKQVKASDLLLMRDGVAVPLQLSGVETENGFLKRAVVNFISELPSGGRLVFELTRGTPPAAPPQVKESREGAAILLDTGAMKVRLPSARAIAGEIPGPLAGISRGGAWFGGSRIVSPKRKALTLEVKRVESGPLFIEYRLQYRFEGSATYAATVRAVAGYDHLQFFEEMTGFERDEGARMETHWKGFQPTHRQAPNHPYFPRPPVNGKNGHARFTYERIDEKFVSTQHGVSGGGSPEGEMPFRLGVYEPWGAYVILNEANFWDERTDDAVAVFIDHNELWEDHDYSIWSASPALQVRYFYKDGEMTWRWPLLTGTRSTGVAAYGHQKDVAETDRLETRRGEFFPSSYGLFLQLRYGLLDLNVVKDWVLEYPESAKRPPVLFRDGQIKTLAEFGRQVNNSALMNGLSVSGVRQNAGYNPVASRTIYENWVDAYNRFYPQMTAAQRKRITAWFLMMAYVDAGEEMMPMRPMLSGHPNFLADIKNIPAMMALLFPEHPKAQEWADEFGKFVEMNTRYHTRPTVASWESNGGRWTENLGTYVWAFLRPSLRGSLILQDHLDGKNRFALPQVAAIGDWVLNALSAPFNGEDPKYSLGPDGKLPRHAWGLVTPEVAPRRLHPPQGAHSARRMPPRSMWLLGNTLRNYTPLLAEYLMWAARSGDDDSEFAKELVDSWSILYPAKDNRGTNPHLVSSKFTGYGITLRAGVDTANEVSVHLQQIDEGPNYRWGVAGEGGSGVLYYYANGKSYSHNAREDVGDRAAHDTDFCSNFAVWKGGQFKSVGRNVMERPLYDLKAAQFAELTPREGAGAYSWPEYVGRSVMLVGADYFVTYDQVYNDAVAHRFSWFTQAGDEMPFIAMVKGGVRERQKLMTKVETETTKGVWHDGMGDAMAVISHRRDLNVEPASYGAQVSAGGGTDYIFRNPAGVDFDTNGVIFRGTAGVVRKRAGGEWEVALFRGSRIGAGGVEIAVDGKDLGLSAVYRDAEDVRGVYFGRTGGKLKLNQAGKRFFVDGAAVAMGKDGSVQLPAGRHQWQWTAGLPVPNAPRILRTSNISGGADVVVENVAGATRSRLELSRNGGKTWSAAANPLLGLENGAKVHVRAIAMNESRESSPGPEYPVYISAEKPVAPQGLRWVRGEVSWGEVLGAHEYRLYRRVRGGSFQQVYSGTVTAFTDQRAGIHEYAAAAVSGNGESAKSPVVDSDPASWANWDPKPGEPFRRRVVHATSQSSTGMGTYYPK